MAKKMVLEKILSVTPIPLIGEKAMYDVRYEAEHNNWIEMHGVPNPAMAREDALFETGILRFYVYLGTYHAIENAPAIYEAVKNLF